MGVLIGYALPLALFGYFAWGGVTTAKRAFAQREVKVVGNVTIRGRWALACGVLFAAFGTGFALLCLSIVLAFFTS